MTWWGQGKQRLLSKSNKFTSVESTHWMSLLKLMFVNYTFLNIPHKRFQNYGQQEKFQHHENYAEVQLNFMGDTFQTYKATSPQKSISDRKVTFSYLILLIFPAILTFSVLQERPTYWKSMYSAWEKQKDLSKSQYSTVKLTLQTDRMKYQSIDKIY